MKEIIIDSLSSIDGREHILEVPDNCVKEIDPMFQTFVGDIRLSLDTGKGYKVKISSDSGHRTQPGIVIGIDFPNERERYYYFSERAYNEGINSPNYWSEGQYHESDGIQAKNLSVHYQRRNGKNTGVQKIWSRYKTPLDNTPWPKGHEQDIPAEMLEQYEASLTQLPRVKEVIKCVMDEFENAIPGITDFILLDKKFGKIKELMSTEVQEETMKTMDSMLYENSSDMKLCDVDRELLNNISNYIVNNEEFPFEQLGIDKEKIPSESFRYTTVYDFFPIPGTKKNVSLEMHQDYYKKLNGIRLEIIGPNPSGGMIYSEMYFGKENGTMREYDRIIKISYPSYEYDTQEEPEIHEISSDFSDNYNLKCSKIIRRKNNSDLADIDYCSFMDSNKHAYERVSLKSDDKTLNSLGYIDVKELREKVASSEDKELERSKYRDMMLDSKDITFDERASKLSSFVKNGLTLRETLGMTRAFVNELPYSMDPTLGSFIPGAAFFKEPIDLHQLNHRMYDDKEHKTIFKGMMSWGDTRRSARAIALCALFQQMLISERVFTPDEIKSFINNNGLLVEYNSVTNMKDATEINKLLNDVASKIGEKAKAVLESKGLARMCALKDAYKEISKVGGRSITDDLRIYYVAQDQSNYIPPINIEPAQTVSPELNKKIEEYAKVNSVLPVLDSIYYSTRNVSLNSKRLCMLQVATQLIKDKNLARKIVERNYKFDVRRVDVRKSTAPQKQLRIHNK